jgi:hypothetical protein
VVSDTQWHPGCACYGLQHSSRHKRYKFCCTRSLHVPRGTASAPLPLAVPAKLGPDCMGLCASCRWYDREAVRKVHISYVPEHLRQQLRPGGCSLSLNPCDSAICCCSVPLSM